MKEVIKGSTMVSIRRAQEEDFSVLAELGEQSFIQSHGWSAPPDVIGEYKKNNFTGEACKKQLSDLANVYHILYHNHKPAGYSKIIFNAPPATIPIQTITKLERLYLLKEYYGLGLGFHLLQFNIELSKEHNQSGMWLEVWKENQRAIDFYQKAGFKVTGSGFFKLTEAHSNPDYEMLLKY